MTTVATNASLLEGGQVVIAEGKHSQQLLAKAHQLKEKALATTDRTRRNQFLLIATEYRKLALLYAPTEHSMPLDGSRQSNEAPERGRAPVVYLHSHSPMTEGQPQVTCDEANQADTALYFVLFAAMAMIAFALVLTPGDQVLEGLQSLFDLWL